MAHGFLLLMFAEWLSYMLYLGHSKRKESLRQSCMVLNAELFEFLLSTPNISQNGFSKESFPQMCRSYKQ